jgi:exodeoxyribonuclease V alpha subunit
LLYTAITRAKDMCYIIGMSKTFDIGCSKLEITKRQTVLKELLS